MEIAAYSDIGRMRAQNQDAYYVPDAGMPNNLLVVADGMGGHRAGKTASNLALKAMLSALQASLNDVTISIPFSQEYLELAFEQANRQVHRMAMQHEAMRGMGTTLTAALFHPENERDWIIAQVGDSRAYRFGNGTLQRLTKDHSLVEEMLSVGEITQEEAWQHPRRNVITRCIGTSAVVDADYYQAHLSLGDILMLCSDGLSATVTHTEIQEILCRVMSLHETAKELVALANAKGGSDNITVILARSGEGEGCV